MASADGRIAEVFLAFLKLGLTSFGGPIAHLGYFRDEFVQRRRWIDEAGYADLVALCQFLPGPASSQVGFALGLIRGGGVLGGLAAWFGFTLPSAFALIACALGIAAFDGPAAAGALHGLKLVAVAVVAHAVWGMARTLAPDPLRAAIAFAAFAMTALIAGALGQIGAIAAGAAAGLLLCRSAATAASAGGAASMPVDRRSGALAVALAAGLLVLTPALVALGGGQGVALFDAFYRAGALVFGGGHVVLPLLQSATVDPGWVSGADFLAGYGLAQAVPGPLFTFVGYLGTAAIPYPNGLVGGLIALVAVFLPGLLLVYGALPFWSALRATPSAQAGLRGANAAVVGVLGAALYDPVWTSAVVSVIDVTAALGGFLALAVWRLPPWSVVAGLAALGALAALV